MTLWPQGKLFLAMPFAQTLYRETVAAVVGLTIAMMNVLTTLAHHGYHP
jgi:hypothetical protein